MPRLASPPAGRSGRLPPPPARGCRPPTSPVRSGSTPSVGCRETTARSSSNRSMSSAACRARARRRRASTQVLPRARASDRAGAAAASVQRARRRRTAARDAGGCRSTSRPRRYRGAVVAAERTSLVPLRRNRDFVLLESGRLLSTAGSQLTTIAYPLLVLALTHSPAKAGIVSFARAIPLALFALPAGSRPTGGIASG